MQTDRCRQRQTDTYTKGKERGLDKDREKQRRDRERRRMRKTIKSVHPENYDAEKVRRKSRSRKNSEDKVEKKKNNPTYNRGAGHASRCGKSCRVVL